MEETKNNSPQSIALKGEEIYNKQLKSILEKDNKGKFLAIDIDTSEYFLGDTLEEALEKAKEKYPHKLFYVIRIGYSGIYNVSRTIADGNNWFL